MFLFGGMSLSAQKILSVHKVKKKETVFGIAKEYGVTIDELRNANPFMREPDFVLKKGMSVNIPEHNPQLSVTQPATTVTKSATKTPVSSSMINVGVMLPLHDINGDGKRMVEYYRGMLLAAKDLRKEGYNLTINAWNVAEEDNIGNTLSATNAAKCNVVFGPLYTSQVRQLADFCMEKNIAMVIPFSITVMMCRLAHRYIRSIRHRRT